MGMPWAVDSSADRAHCWLSDNFSVRTETLCLDRPESPNSDYVCVAVKGHRGRCDHRWTGNDWPQFKPMSVREAAGISDRSVGIPQSGMNQS